MLTWLAARFFGGNTLFASIAVYALAALLAGGALWGYGAWKYSAGYDAGRAQERAAALGHAMDLIKERSQTNEEIGRMDDAELCRELGGQWVPDTASCE